MMAKLNWEAMDLSEKNKHNAMDSSWTKKRAEIGVNQEQQELIFPLRATRVQPIRGGHRPPPSFLMGIKTKSSSWHTPNLENQNETWEVARSPNPLGSYI
jgi:hypothetical protein